ncbi:MAG: hypothetical protein R2733_04240 [Acidimicrobiales bacterium]
MTTITLVTLRARTTLLAIARRRLTVAILVAMPLVFYLVSHDAVGRAVRSLAFGLSWSISTVAFFAAQSARELEPRLGLAGARRSHLLLGRLLGLLVAAAGLTTVFSLIVSIDEPRSMAGVVLDFAVTCLVAIGLGTAVGALLDRELEGTLVLFFFAGLQAIVNPFDTYSRLLPFWSSRELGTFAVDGPDVGSLGDGLTHAAITLALCVVVVTVSLRGTAARPSRLR